MPILKNGDNVVKKRYVMARKIVHTKRGTYYNGPGGRRKVADPLGSLFSIAAGISKASKSSSKKKKSASHSSSFNNVHYDSSDGIASTIGCLVICVTTQHPLAHEWFLRKTAS